jgi:hypothetical protein
MACDVCGVNPQIGVAAIPGVPMSVAYCEECLRANAHPYGIMVINTAMISGGLEEAAEWWREMVDDTLRHLGKTRAQFDLDVELERREMNDFFERELSKPVPEVAPVGPDDPF